MGASGLTDRPVVLVAIKGLGIGGAEKLISEGARFWNRDRFSYHVAYMLPWKDQLVPDLEALDVPVTCLGSKRGMTPASVWRLRRLVDDIDANIVHAHSPTVGIACRVAVPTPLVYTEHGLANRYREPTRTLNRLTYRRNTASTAVSEPVAASVSGFGGPTPTVIRNGVAITTTSEEATAARNELRLGPDDPLVVHVGNIRPEKGHSTLIASVEYLPKDVTVVSIGGEKSRGDLDRVRTASADAGAASRLRFLGHRRDARAFIATADVYVNPSDHEGLPITILEALALGRPVVATAVGGVPSVVRDGETGVLVRPGQPRELAAAVSGLLNNPPLARRLGQRGREFVTEEYGLGSMVRAFEQLYVELLDG